MQELLEQLKKTPVVYVSRDIERALGLSLDTEGYFIISNATEYGKKIAEERKNILLIETQDLLDTWELLEREETKQFIESVRNTYQVSRINLLVFKNTPQIERICSANNWNLLNPSAKLSAQIEEKISQVDWLDELSSLLPPHYVRPCKEVMFSGAPFILQFNRAHTGSGTILIESLEHLQLIQEQFPNRDVRITNFISGPMFTSNNVVLKDRVLMGNINYQITGLAPFTDNTFATIGNDWELPHSILNSEQKEQYGKMVTAVGQKLRKSGWKGLFGIDVVLEAATGKLYLIEINARQPASTTFESVLQRTRSKEQGTIGLSTFEAHLISLLNNKVKDITLIPIETGAQIIQRVTGEIKEVSTQIQKEIEALGYTVTNYENTEPNSDVLRIQNLKKNFMLKHTVFNHYGEEIKNMLSK